MNFLWQELNLATRPSPGGQNDDPAPQCVACQRRNIPCDSTPISCTRCREDGNVCPGYTDAFKTKHTRTPHRRQDGNNCAKPSRSLSTSLQSVPSSTQQAKDWTILMEAIKYYNSSIVPFSRPAHLPFRRQTVPSKYWDLMPDILRSLWIVNVNAMRAGRCAIDPYANAELIRYRGRSLIELQKLMKDLSEAVKDPLGIALYSILFLMGSDLQLPDSGWKSHLEAARRVIGLKGGLKPCFGVFPPASQGPLINFLMADAITATTCPSYLLGTAFVETQMESLGALPSLQQDLIASGSCYPLPLLTILIQTNILRAQQQTPQANGQAKPPLDIDPTVLLQNIQAFDCETWTSHVAAFGRCRPETLEHSLPIASIICLRSLAQCYKAAVLLYLAYSCMSLQTSTDPTWRQAVHAATHSLTQHLDLLFNQGRSERDTGCDGLLHTQLWKFVSWPLFVGVYVHAAWGHDSATVYGNEAWLGSDRTKDTETYIQRLRAVAAATGGRNLLKIEDLVMRVHETRSACAERGLDFVWKWDNGFAERSIFVV